MAIKAALRHGLQPILEYNDDVRWIYISPHFDDVALSCGGLVWEQVQAGSRVEIWSVCSAEPRPDVDLSPFAQELHARWQAGQNGPAKRRMEDQSSCRRLGAGYRHLEFLDCIYRRHPETDEYLYTSERALNAPLHPGDSPIISELANFIRKNIQGDARLVSPLAIGNHVDHQLTRLALESLGQELWYYADYPYVELHREEVAGMEYNGWVKHVSPLSTLGLTAWQDSIAAHRSQISTFWPGEAEMRRAIEAYRDWCDGSCLWTRREE